MATLDPHEDFQETLAAVTSGLKESFPIRGRKTSLHLVGVHAGEMPDPEDIASQYAARVAGKSWMVPVQGTLELRDNETDKVLLTQKTKLMSIPAMTKRFSFIYNGQEHQSANQWQLKPGVFARRQENGELEARFNVVNRAAFKMKLDPESQLFHVEYKKSNLPAYPLLRAMGVSDDDMKAAWGDQVFQANKQVKRQAGVLSQFYRTSTNGKAPPEDEVALQDHLRQVMKESKVRPEVVERTLGHKVDHVDAKLMLNAGSKLIAVQNGAPEDDRDSLEFKTLRSTGDFIKDQIQTASRNLGMKVQRQLNKGDLADIRHAFRPGMFDEAVRKLFQSSLVNPAKQINPVDMVGTAMQTTIMGPGGIKSDIQVTEAAKQINPSQFGMIDPLTTPEGGATGISLRLPIGVKRIGDQPHIPVYSLKEKKTVYVSPEQMMRSKKVFPDEVEFKNGVPHPLNKKVKALGHGNEPEIIDFHEADYVIKDPSQVYGTTVNLVPFLQNNSGGRVSMASRHIEQSISLRDRDKPLVRVMAPGHSHTFEEMIGQQSAHVSPVDGKVTKVTPDGIHVKDASGKEHLVHIYNNYPVNDAKSVLHSTPLVKPGDSVKKGGVLADNNYTRDGVLALGKNLRTAFMSYHGLNFEDGIVVTESAAKKLTSNHLHKEMLAIPEINNQLIFDTKKFQAAHPLAFTKDQLTHIGADGVAKVGSKIKPGDPLVLAMQPYQIKDRTGIGAIRKSLTNQLVDKSLRWESDVPGEIVSVHRNDQGIHVHVRTEEPVRVGDKLCFDAATEVLTSRGWIPVREVTMQDEVCCLDPATDEILYQRPTALHSYATGGWLYEIRSQQIDLRVTASHRMYVKQRGAPGFTLVPAQDIQGKRVQYKKNGTWKGKVAPEMVLPEYPVPTKGGGVRFLPEKRIPARTYLMLLGMYLSEGSVFHDYRRGKKRLGGIALPQTKPDTRKEMLEALAQEGISYQETEAGVRINSVHLALHFAQFGHSFEKFIPDEIFQYSKEDLGVLLRWLMWGDGHSEEGKYISYCTTSRQLADDVQRLCLHVGLAANIQRVVTSPLLKNGKTYARRDRYDVRIVKTKLTPEVNHGHTRRQSAQQEQFVYSEEPVFCVTVPTHVLYVRRNGKPCWSGNSHRHGGKGIITAIIPDKEAPHSKDGKPVDLLFQPGGLGGRMNIGQVLEAMTGKIAEKTGKPYFVKNFDPKVKDWTRHVMGEMKAHGLSDTEELFDPKTGLSYGQVMTGPIHFLKLVHQMDKKESMRSGMSLPRTANHEKYDPTTLQPASGGGTGGQSWGQLGIYALLAHGAKGILRESMTFKSEGEDAETNESKRWRSQHNEVWGAIQTGQPLPPPKPTFSFHRFTELIKGAGINVEKKGDEFVLSPLTNSHILKMSKGEVSDPTAVVHSRRDENGVFKPIKGGLFDEKITGGHGGTGWSHIKLPEPMPNPVFEEPIKKVLGITEPTYQALVEGSMGVNPLTGKVGKYEKGFLVGGTAFKKLLGAIDVNKELAKTRKELDVARPSAVNNLYKKARYLQGLSKAGMKADDAYVLDYLPVVPPKLRPLSNLDDGALHYEGINGIYNQLGQLTNAMNSPAQKMLPESHRAESRKSLYEHVASLFGTAALPEGAKDKGILHMISGTQPKRGLAQKGLLSRRQDASARATIIPEPKLSLDEVGLPKEMAMTIFRPQLVRQLVVQGSAKDELTAQNMLADAHKGKEDPSIASALNNLANQEFVIAKRDPALWKYSVQAFRPKIVEGKAIRIHPLVTGGFNADFDGDQMSIQVPFTDAAKRDAARMLPSKNIFSESTGGVAYLPSMESLLGLHRLSLVGQAKGASFSTDKDVVAALHAKRVDLNEQVKLGGKLTTPGRVLLASAVPDSLKEKMLTDFSLELNKKGVNTVYTSIGKDHAPRFAHFADKLKDLGYDTSTGIINTPLAAQGKVSVGAHSFKLTDFLADSATRDPILHKADAEVDAIRQKPGLRPEERKRQIAEAYLRADAEMQAQHKAQGKMQTNALGKMSRAGMKPGMDQYKQMIIAPMVMANSKGELIPVPVRKSYGEGVDQMGYTVQQEGARSGTIKKVQEVQEPGYMTKLLQNTSMHTLIDSHDCGTTKGRLVGIGDYDIVDRHLAAPLKTHGLDLPGGTLLTKDVVDRIRKVDPNAKLSVRSPIHCHSEKGVCQKCYGLDANGKHLDIGSNVGVLSAHTLGERAVQLTLKAFHCLHEHSLVLVRHKGRVYHTTLRAVFEGSPGTDPEVRHPQDLDVWGPEGWVRVLGASRHLQEPGTQMVFARTRSGFGLLSQDNHPHMLAENLAVCERCGTYPKRSNGGKQHYCRRCGRTWQGELPEPADFQMVMPSELSEKSHTAKVSWGPSPAEQEPPLRSGWLAGMFCAEGYVHAQNQEQGSYVIGFGISQNQGTPVYTKLGSCLAQEFPEARLGARPRAFQVYGRERGLFFEKTFGRYSRNKGLPEGWSGLPVAWLADFVSGVFDGDGTLVSTKDSSWKVGRIDTTSYLLAQQLHHILRSRGIHSRVLLSPWHKASLHQGFAVTFPITAEAKELLSASLKLADVAARPHGNEERFGEVVDYVRPVRFGAPPWVYDLETETSTLCVNNVWTHNSGGVATAGGGALGAFGRLEQLTYLPDHIPNAAVHATVHGKIEKIEPTATGTNIYIHGKAHFVGKDSKGNPLNEKQEGVFHKKAWTAPHVGMEVNPGDFLSDPNRTNLNPHRYFEATKSMDKVQEKLADEMHGLYADEGVRKRAVEVVVRSMGNLTQIEHPGEGTDFLRGQTYSRSAVETLNKELKAHGKGLITHKPVLRGVNLLPLDMTTDWMARLNHQKLRGTMMEGAAQGWASDIHGRHPVPGLMYGAEFGRQSTDPRKGGKTNFY